MRRDAHGGCEWRNILQHDRIGTNLGVISYRHSSQNLGTRADVHMPTDTGCPVFSATQSNLLKYQTIGSYRRIRVDNDAIWMRQQQSTANARTQGNIGAGDGAPKAMPQNRDFSQWECKRIIRSAPSFMTSQTCQQRAVRLPGKHGLGFARPIRHRCGNRFESLRRCGFRDHAASLLWCNLHNMLSFAVIVEQLVTLEIESISVPPTVKVVSGS